MWAGETVAVLASGPSMSQEIADSVKHLPRIAVNRTYELARDADVIYASDGPWWLTNPCAWACPGIKASIEIKPGVMPAGPDCLQVLRNSGTHGFDPRRDFIRSQNNSGGAAIHLAAHAGASQILLLGFDMHGWHWHPTRDQSPERAKRMAGAFHRWKVGMVAMASALSAMGVEVINCTPGSALRCFPMRSLESVINIREAA